MSKLSFVAAAALSAAFVVPAMAQDAAKVDAKHYTVEFENDQIRILRIKYGPKEKSVMHAHPNSVAVFLTEARSSSGCPMGRRRTPP
jgi:hypothetical protein